MSSKGTEKRDQRLTLLVTQSELYMISRKAHSLGMSRPNLVVDAVLKYCKDNNSENIPDHNKVVELLNTLPFPVFRKRRVQGKCD